MRQGEEGSICRLFSRLTSLCCLLFPGAPLASATVASATVASAAISVCERAQWPPAEVGALAVIVTSPLFHFNVAKKRIVPFFFLREDLFLTSPH